MNKHGKTTIRALSGLVLALPLGLIILSASRTPIEVKASMSTDPYTYTLNSFSPSDVKTNIDLTDLSDNDIRSYYSGLNGLPESERKGGNLLKNLKRIICTNPLDPEKPARYASYGEETFKLYSVTDREWDLYDVKGWGGTEKNAISDATLNANKDMILTYTYPSNDGASKEHSTNSSDPYTHYYYRNDNLTSKNGLDDRAYGFTGTGKLSYTNALLNREHLWSQSHGFNQEFKGAGTDIHHLVAADTTVNSSFHSNYSYAEVGVLAPSYENNCANWGTYKVKDGVAGGKTITLSDLYEQTPNAIAANRYGTSLTPYEDDGDVKTVFEPQDCDKGEIARALLFMCARYNWISSWNPSTGVTTTHGSPTASEPDLMLVNKIINKADAEGDADGQFVSEYGCLNDLLRWNREFKPTPYEIHRNNLIYKNYQYTRNPFIDFPEWADYIWGRAVDNPTYTPRNSNGYFNPLGAASPDSDPINTFESESVTLSKSVLGLDLSGTVSAPLTATTSDGSAITWSSSDPTVVSLSSASSMSDEAITLTALREGNATITASATIYGSPVSATCSVTVINSADQPVIAHDTETISLTIESFDSHNAYGTEDAWTVNTDNGDYTGYADLHTTGTSMQNNPSGGTSLTIGIYNEIPMPGRIIRIDVTAAGNNISAGSIYVHSAPIFERTDENTYSERAAGATQVSFTQITANTTKSIDTSSAGDVHYFSIGSGAMKAARYDIVCDVAADAEAYASSFLSGTSSTCASSSAKTASSFLSAWNASKAKYNSLSISAKTLAKNPSLIENTSKRETVQDAYDRYVYILTKYDALGTTLINYLNASISGAGYLPSTFSFTPTWIIAVALLTSTAFGTAIAFQLFRKKKKEA